MLESTSSLLRTAPIRGLLATRPLRITTRWSSATSLVRLSTVRMARHKPAGDGTSADEVPATVAAVALPEVAVDQSRSNFIAAVRTSAIDAKNKLVGFQGDFTFDERVVTFQSEPVRKAGITGGNWNVSGNVLPGRGPIRTLRISAYSNDFTPLSGSGTLFELRMTRVSKAAQGTQLLWAAPPDQFIFIDADLKTQKPGNAAPGSVTPSGKRKKRPAIPKPLNATGISGLSDSDEKPDSGHSRCATLQVAHVQVSQPDAHTGEQIARMGAQKG